MESKSLILQGTGILNAFGLGYRQQECCTRLNWALAESLLRRNILQDDFDVSFPQCTSAHVPHSSPSPAHQWSQEVLSVSRHPPPVQAALTPPPRCHASIQHLYWLGNHGRDQDSRSTYEGPFLHHIVNRYPQHSVLIASHRELLTQSAHTILQWAGKSIMWGRCRHPIFPTQNSWCVSLSTVPDPFSLGKSGNNRANALYDPRWKAFPLLFPASPNTKRKEMDCTK